MSRRPVNVLILCTGNSARSILGEAIVNRLGEGRFRGFSAGSRPKGAVHPGALRLLARHGYATEGLRFGKLVELPILDREVPAMAVRQRLQAIHDEANHTA